mmetsp:Transcript_8864/g.26908  ORF Transcript_8864/g.26908 Transcript_8864/m.26908 type:complete len:224 (+) Transcript_8864:269-940(+)
MRRLTARCGTCFRACPSWRTRSRAAWTTRGGACRRRRALRRTPPLWQALFSSSRRSAAPAAPAAVTPATDPHPHRCASRRARCAAWRTSRRCVRWRRRRRRRLRWHRRRQRRQRRGLAVTSASALTRGVQDAVRGGRRLAPRPRQLPASATGHSRAQPLTLGAHGTGQRSRGPRTPPPLQASGQAEASAAAAAASVQARPGSRAFRRRSGWPRPRRSSGRGRA